MGLELAHKHDKSYSSWIKHLKRLKLNLKRTTKLKTIVGLLLIYYLVLQFK